MRRMIWGVVTLSVCICAVDAAEAGSLMTWGSPMSEDKSMPEGNDLTRVSLSSSHGLALRQDGSLAGWGWNLYGQADVPSGNDFVAVAAGETHSVVLRADGSLEAWGYNGWGESDEPPRRFR